MAAAAIRRTSRCRLAVPVLCLGLVLAVFVTPREAWATLAAPANIVATPDCQKITVTATPLAGAVAYVVRIWVEDYTPALLDTIIPSLPFYDYPPVGERRTYHVAGIDASQEVGTFGTSNILVAVQGPAPEIDLGSDRAVLTNAVIVIPATGTLPAGTTYTWRRNGVSLGAPSQPAYVKPSPVLADSGLYSCIVCNLCGCDTSAGVFVHVANAPLRPTTVNVPLTCDSITVSWPPVSGAWAYLVDRDPPFSPPPHEGPWPGKKVTSNIFVDHPMFATSYQYKVYSVIYDSLFSTTPRLSSSTQLRQKPVIMVEPQGRKVEIGTTVTLAPMASGTNPVTTTWRRNGAIVQVGPYFEYTIVNAQPAQSGNYDAIICNACGCDTTRAALVTVCTTPTITVAATDRWAAATEGTNKTLTATVTDALSQQWYRGGIALTDGPKYSGTTTNALTIINPQMPDGGWSGGYYELRATGECQTVSSGLISLTVAVCPDPAVITQQPPAKQVVPLGGSVTLSVAATCCRPVTYLWLRRPFGGNGGSFVGNEPTLTLDPVTNASYGEYNCIIFNGYQYTTSQTSVVASASGVVFTWTDMYPGCTSCTVPWATDVPVSVTLRYWSGSCDNGVGGTVGPTSLQSSGYLQVPVVPGQQLFARIEGVTASNQTGYSDCFVVAAKSAQPQLYPQLLRSPQYVTMPFGKALPLQFAVQNTGCSAFDGEITVTQVEVDGVLAMMRDQNGNPAFPLPILPAQLTPGFRRESSVFYLPMASPPPPHVTWRLGVVITALYTPVGGSPTPLKSSNWVYITSQETP